MNDMVAPHSLWLVMKNSKKRVAKGFLWESCALDTVFGDQEIWALDFGFQIEFKPYSWENRFSNTFVNILLENSNEKFPINILLFQKAILSCLLRVRF